ncbi:META domain-containing protein [Nocardioides stalactiti]|uniref:META domain-containing protein n=1 Tax=Nocardioides stalactiti TaxID=2755356 RepID=UPI0016035A2F|nr:META domain-containing protein [Nocardioides stalactiti]
MLGVWLSATSGCTQADHGVEADPVVTGEWIPVEVDGYDFEAGFEPTTAELGLADDGTWTASDGCHPLSGTYRIVEDQLTIEQEVPEGFVMGTGCARGEIPYAQILPRVTEVQQDDPDEMLLLDEDEDVVLRLRRS